MENNTEDQGINLSGAIKNATGEEIDLSGAISVKPKSTKKTEVSEVSLKKKEPTVSKSTLPAAPSTLGSKDLGKKLILESASKVSKESKPKPGESQGLLLKDPAKFNINYFDPSKKDWQGQLYEDVKIEDLSKNITTSANDLAKMSKDYKAKQDALNKEIENLNGLIQTGSISPQEAAQAQSELKKQQELTSFDGVKITELARRTEADQARLNKNVGVLAYDKAHQGSFGGAAWNSIVESIKGIVNTYDTIGSRILTENLAAFGQIKDWEKDAYEKKLNKALSEKRNRVFGKAETSTTPEYASRISKESDWAAAALGVTGSIVPLATGSMFTSTFGAAKEALDNMEGSEKMTEGEKAIYAASVGLVTGELEKIGFKGIQSALKGTAGPISKFASWVFKSVPKNASINVIQKKVAELAATTAGQKILQLAETKAGKAAVGVTEAAAGEFVTGGSQKAGEMAIQELFDSANGLDVFKNPELFSAEAASAVVQDAKLEAMGSVLMFGVGYGAKTLLKASTSEKLSDKEYTDFKALLSSPEMYQAKLSEISGRISSGKITVEEGQQEVNEINDARNIIKQIPDTLPDKDQKQAFLLISENNKVQGEIDDLSKQIADKNPQLVTGVTEEINKKQEVINSNNQKLLNLSQNAVQEQTTSEVPVQPETGTGGEVAQGEPQPETQVATQESKGQEVVVNQLENKSDSDIENRMSEIEDNEDFVDEYNVLEKEMEKRERDSVFNVPLENVKDVLNSLSQKEKEMPNGYGTFIEPQDIRESKAVVSKYLNTSEISDSQLMSDFTTALRGNPTTWYADGLKLRESIKESQKRGIPINDLIDKAVSIYTKDGYDVETAKSVVAGMIEPLIKGAKTVSTTPGQSNTAKIEAKKETEINIVDKIVEQVKEQQRIYPKRSLLKHLESGINNLQKSEAYINADDIAREQMVRDVRKALGVKETRVKSKVLPAKPAPKTTLVNDAEALRSKLKDLEKTDKEAKKFAESAKKIVTDYVTKNLKGAVDAKGLKKILDGLSGSLLTAADRAKAISKIMDVINKSENVMAIDKLKLLNAQIKSEARAAKAAKKEGIKETKEQLNERAAKKKQVFENVVSEVKAMLGKAKVSAKNVKTLLTGLTSNLENDVIRERILDKIRKVIDKADYLETLNKAQETRKSVAKLKKADNIIVSLKNAANAFLKLNPELVEDIDEYQKVADQLKAALVAPVITERQLQEFTKLEQQTGEQPKLTRSNKKTTEAYEVTKSKIPAILSYVKAYAQEQQVLQDEILKEMKLSEYQDLVDEGKISKDMSLKEIQKYINDIVTDEQKAEKADDRKQFAIDYVQKSFDNFRNHARFILDGFAPFAGQIIKASDTITGLDKLTTDVKKVVDEFLTIDISKVKDIKTMFEMQDALANFIVNGTTDRMEALYARYEGNKNAKELYDSGKRLQNFRAIFGGTNSGSLLWAKNITQIDQLFRWVGRGASLGDLVKKMSGITEFENKQSQSEDKVNEVKKRYSDKFLKTKPNGKKFLTKENVNERGIYARLLRTVVGSPEEQQKEFDRMKRQIDQTIKFLLQSNENDYVKEGEAYQKVYDKVKNAKNIQEVQAIIDPINQQAVEFIADEFSSMYPEIKNVARNVYNLELEDDLFYTPISYTGVSDKGRPGTAGRGTFGFGQNILSTEASGSFQRVTRPDDLPGYIPSKNGKPEDFSEIERVLDLNFDTTVFNTMEKTLVDTYTAKAVSQWDAFSNSSEFKKMFQSNTDYDAFVSIVDFYVNNARGRVFNKSSLKFAVDVSNALKTYAATRALGSIWAFPKQAITALFNTTLQLMNDPDALSFGIATMRNEKANELLEKSGRSIKLRGLESTSDLKSEDNLKMDSLFETATKPSQFMGKFWMKTFMGAGDKYPARASWWAYYFNKMHELDKDFYAGDVDWNTYKLNDEAADYANTQINVAQNASSSKQLGQLFTSKDPVKTIIRSMVIPYASFIFNAKDRIRQDITVLTSKNSTKEDKYAASRSLAGTMGEMGMYQALASFGNYGLILLAGKAVGLMKDDEEEAQKKIDMYLKSALTQTITDVASPLPNLGDVVTIAAVNWLADVATDDEEEDVEEKKSKYSLLFEQRPESMIGAMTKLLASPLSSVGTNVYSIYDTFDRINSDEYKNDRGQVIEFTPEQKETMKAVMALQIATALNLLPSDVDSFNKKVIKAVEKQAKEE